MSLRLLVDALVHEAAGLVAAVATHQGARTPLADVTDRMFHGLATHLQELEVRRRVCADMFRMAPRAYIRRVRRVEQSATDRGRSLWEAVYEYVASREPVTWTELGSRFHRDDEEVLRGILRDLKDSGLILVRGRGPKATYRAATGSELGARIKEGGFGTDELVWALIYRDGPVSMSQLERMGGVARPELEEVLGRLAAANLISAQQREGEQAYRSSGFSPQKDDDQRWEGAVFDHFYAVVKTLSTFLTRPDAGASAVSTYTFDLTADHPMAGEVKQLFSDLRTRASELRTRVDAYNAQHGTEETERTILYLGLCRDVPAKPVPKEADSGGEGEAE